MKHTTKLLTVLATVIAVFSLTGCPKPVGEIDDEPIEVVHEHSWGEGVITTEPTCTKKGVRTFTCECGAKRTEEVAPLGHDFQGGYCERCGEYEFENHIEIKVFTDVEDFKSAVPNLGKTSSESNGNKDNYKMANFSFNNTNVEMTLTDLIQLKSKYKDYKVVRYNVYRGKQNTSSPISLFDGKVIETGETFGKINSILIEPIE